MTIDLMALLPAAAAWEMRSELPRMSIALHGAAGLLSALLEEGVPRPSRVSWTILSSR
jgi:hypothetical protein